jgi:hypothetical protein
LKAGEEFSVIVALKATTKLNEVLTASGKAFAEGTSGAVIKSETSPQIASEI